MKVGEDTGRGDSTFHPEGLVKGAEAHQGVGGDMLDLKLVVGQHDREEVLTWEMKPALVLLNEHHHLVRLRGGDPLRSGRANKPPAQNEPSLHHDVKKVIVNQAPGELLGRRTLYLCFFHLRSVSLRRGSPFRSHLGNREEIIPKTNGEGGKGRLVAEGMRRA